MSKYTPGRSWYKNIPNAHNYEKMTNVMGECSATGTTI